MFPAFQAFINFWLRKLRISSKSDKFADWPVIVWNLENWKGIQQTSRPAMEVLQDVQKKSSSSITNYYPRCSEAEKTYVQSLCPRIYLTTYCKRTPSIHSSFQWKVSTHRTCFSWQSDAIVASSPWTPNSHGKTKQIAFRCLHDVKGLNCRL